MRYLPIFYDMKNVNVIIAGGGEVAVSKLKILLKTDAQLHVVASKIHQDIEALEGEGRVRVTRRKIQESDIRGAQILYSTYYGEALNSEIRQMGKNCGVLVNVVDTPSECDFISPAIVDRDPVVVAIGTEGTAPVLARKIKASLEEELSPNLGLMARVAKGFREAVEQLPFGRPRRDYWRDYYANDIANEEQAALKLSEMLEHKLKEEKGAGFVSFVGAGPGDPELLTLKARKAIDKADVIIHDRLVSPEILELARREATLINVGKKGFGASYKQEEINDIIVEEARKGELVVRLKGGDPSIFGRLDEELEVIRKEHIAFEVIPGITTALAAAARVEKSLTSRNKNQELRILTAHDVKGFSEHDWHSLAKENAVAAIYMGRSAARFLQGRLLIHGASPQTPMTVLENVSRASERVFGTTIESLTDTLTQEAVSGPTILLLGIAPDSNIAQTEIRLVC